MKNFNRDSLRLYAVTDRSWLGEQTLCEQVEEALRGGATMVQIREKELDEADFEDEAREIQKLCRKYQVPLIINDNVALAKRVDADGVHIGQSDMEMKNARELLGEDKIIGVTARRLRRQKQQRLPAQIILEVARSLAAAQNLTQNQWSMHFFRRFVKVWQSL